MSEVWLIRHGQASFGAQDYDRLSDLGRRQARWLGEHLRALGVRPARVVAGGLRRQRDTASEMLAGLFGGDGDGDGNGAPPVEAHEGFDEYDAEALLRGWLATRAAPAADDRRSHFRALSEALAAWQRDDAREGPQGAESWAAFCARTRAALDFAEGARGSVTLAVTSGGVIGQCLAAAMGAPPAAMVSLHMQVKNAGYSRLATRRGGHWLLSFNESPHLDQREGALTWS